MEENIGFGLIGIKTEQFAIIEEAYSESGKTKFGAGLQFKIDQKQKQVGVFLTLSFEQKKSVFLKIEVSGHFKIRSEEHTSELQSRPHLVCRLLLEKKKKIK